MEKVRLSLDELQVQSFATTGAAGDRRGTVRANDSTGPVDCPTADPLWDTCWESCWGSCGSCHQSCEGSCDCYSGACGGSESFLASNCQ
ncbi:MAG TPA: hypothetical protein VF006_25040 [Longimicrobium sp.]